jgi:hypothetical protein
MVNGFRYLFRAFSGNVAPRFSISNDVGRDTKSIAKKSFDALHDLAFAVFVRIEDKIALVVWGAFNHFAE